MGPLGVDCIVCLSCITHRRVTNAQSLNARFSGLGIAMLWCFLWIVIMRWLTGFIVWLTILLLLVALGAGKYVMTS